MLDRISAGKIARPLREERKNRLQISDCRLRIETSFALGKVFFSIRNPQSEIRNRLALYIG